MSDIRKEFEEWVVKPVPVAGQLYSESYPIDRAGNGGYSHPFTKCAYEGYKAGRAHDIELIKELAERIAQLNRMYKQKAKHVDNLLKQKKHFGKE